MIARMRAAALPAALPVALLVALAVYALWELPRAVWSARRARRRLRAGSPRYVAPASRARAA